MIAALGACAAPLPLAAQEPLPLWRAAARAGVMFGAGGGPQDVIDPVTRELHLRHSRLFVHENAMKMGAIRRTESPPNYSYAEACLAFAEQNGMLSQAAALVWNDDKPDWFKGKSAAEIGRAMDEHLEAVCTRFYGRFHSYGLVNEPIYPAFNKPNGYRDGPFYAAMGEDYIFRAFKRAAAVDSTTKLFLNEAWCEYDNALGVAVRGHLLTLIDKMLDRGLKLDAIGLQAHLFSNERFNAASFARFLEELSRRKLKIWLTEFDVDDQHFAREITKRDGQVAQATREFLDVALANPNVEMFVSWGLADKSSFYREPSIEKLRARSFPARALPFDDDGREKLITRAIREAFLAAPTRS